MTPFHASQTADRQHHHISHRWRLMLPCTAWAWLTTSTQRERESRGKPIPSPPSPPRQPPKGVLLSKNMRMLHRSSQSPGTGVFARSHWAAPWPPADTAGHTPAGRHVLPKYRGRHHRPLPPWLRIWDLAAGIHPPVHPSHLIEIASHLISEEIWRKGLSMTIHASANNPP